MDFLHQILMIPFVLPLLAIMLPDPDQIEHDSSTDDDGYPEQHGLIQAAPPY